MAVNGNVAKGLGEPSSVRKNHKRCRDSLDKVNDHFIGELQKLRTGSPRTTPTSGGRRCGPQATWTATPSTTMCGEQVSDHHQVPPQHFGLPEDLHSGRVCGHVAHRDYVHLLLLPLQDPVRHRGPRQFHKMKYFFLFFCVSFLF